jgi:hypothetical protein
LNSRHAKTLADIRRTKSTIRWPQVEALFRALGATVTQGAGSRVIVTLNGRRAVFHRPHPAPVLSRPVVRSVAAFLSEVDDV